MSENQRITEVEITTPQTWGWVRLHGRSVNRPCVRTWAAALVERRLLSVTRIRWYWDVSWRYALQIDLLINAHTKKR